MATTVLGSRVDAVIISPTGVQAVHPDGEVASPSRGGRRAP